MNEKTAHHLLDLNRQFYQTFALQFSATRQRLQPGVLQVLRRIPLTNHILDLGCGNGELARELARRGHSGRYIGLDFSSELLKHARLSNPSDFQGQDNLHGDQHFLPANLADPDWDRILAGAAAPPFDFILAFAVLHHLPGVELRRQVLRISHNLLANQGYFIHSEWQFLNSPRLVARLQPWSEAGVTAEDVDPGDYLLDWRRGGSGLRYVHFFSEDELNNLAAETGFQVVESFHSDGDGGELGLYQVWKSA